MKRILILSFMTSCSGGSVAPEEDRSDGSSVSPGSSGGVPGVNFDIGAPTLVEVYVDPASGNDSNAGTPAAPLRTVTAAWNQIPASTTLSTGHGIHLLSGAHTIPVYWESRHGTYQNPIILQGSPGTTMPNVRIFDCRYLYLIGLRIESGGGDVLHLDSCDHILLRKTEIVGTGTIPSCPQETLKANQSQHVYVEDCDISGAWDNAVDCVAVQYGHFLRNRIHRAGDWCMYLKGGSAYFRVEANEFYDGGTGGFTAGQGTGFEFMTPPWLHYEACDVKFVNNFIHDTQGAGMGVNGGYNILLAYNTLYRVGATSHAIEVVFGLRGCDGNVPQCAAYLAQGGWGTATVGVEEPIPDRNVWIYNNLIYNPAGYQSAWRHFAVYGPQMPSAGSNIPSPARCDPGLVIRGNVIWNGPAGLSLGLDDTNLNQAQVPAENAINQFEPQLGADGQPGANVLAYAAAAIPDFSWTDAPPVPSGNLGNAVPVNRAGAARSIPSHPGAD